MTRMTGRDYAGMCNLINTYRYTHTHRYTEVNIPKAECYDTAPADHTRLEKTRAETPSGATLAKVITKSLS